MSKRKVPIDRYGEPDVDYDDLVREAVGPWVNKETFGSYQGDYLYLFRNEGRVGYLVVGFGSCTGCDWLEAVLGYSSWDRMSEDQRSKLRDGLDEMVADFRREVRWFDSEEALIDSIWGDDGNYWYRHESDFREAMEKALSVPTP